MSGVKIVGKVGIRVSPDTSDFPEELRRQLREMKEPKVPVKAELDDKDDTIADLRRKLAKLKAKAAANPVEIKTKVDDKNIAKNISSGIDDGVSDGVVRGQRQLDELSAPKLFDELRKTKIFDPSSVQQYSDRIAQVNRQLRATAKLQAQRLRETQREEARLAAMEADRVARNKKAMDDLAASIKTQAKLEKQRRDAAAAANRAIMDNLQKSIRAQQRLEAQRDAELAKRAREEERLLQERQRVAEKLAASQEKYAKDHKRANDELDRSIRDLDRYFAKISRETGQLPLHLQEARRELDALRNQRNTIGFNIDIDGIEEYKERVRRLKDWTEDEFDDIKANLDPEVSEAWYRRAQSRLAWLARTRIVTLIPQVSRAGAAKAAAALAALTGARMLSETIKNLRDFFKDIDKNLPKIALMATGFLNLASAIIAGSSNLFSLSSSLAQMVPALLVLPGLLGGMAFGLTALIVPMLDINKELPEMKKAWEETRKVISKNFWAEAKKPWQEMIHRILPDFKKGLGDTATAMGDLMGLFGRELSKRLTNGPMLRMFADLAKSITISKTAAAGLANIITILGEKGAGVLPRLSKYMADLTNRFSAFLSAADGDGRLDAWIDRGILRMREFGNVIRQSSRILYGLGVAAENAGGSTLKTLGDQLERIANVVNGRAFQVNMTAVFEAAHKAMGKVSEESGPRVYKFFQELAVVLVDILPKAGATLGELLGSIAEAFSQPAFTGGLISLFTNLEKAVRLVTPAFKPLGAALGDMLELIGELATYFAPLLSTLLTGLSKIFINLKPSISQVAFVLSNALLTVLEALSPVLVDLSKQLAPVINQFGRDFAKVLEILAPHLAAVAKALGGALVSALGKIGASLPEIAEKLFPKLADAIVKLAPRIPELVEGLLGVLEVVANSDLIPSLGNLVNSLLTLATKDILPTLVEYLPTVAQSMSDLANSLTAISDAAEALNVFQGLFAIFKGLNGIVQLFNPARILIDIISGFREGLASGDWDQFWFDFAMAPVNIVKAALGIHSPSTVFMEIGRNVVQGLIDGIAELATGVATKLAEIAAGLKAPFEGAGGWLIAKGSALISGLISGIGSKLGDAKTKVSELASSLREKFATAKDWLVSKGSAFVSGLISGIGSRLGDAKTKAQGLRDAVKNVFSNAKSLLVSAGENIASGLAKGISNGLSWVTSAARSIADAARRAAERILDINSPSRVFRGIGGFISLGLAEGILDQKPVVVQAIEELAAAMTAAEFKIEPDVDINATSRQFKAAAQNLNFDDGDDSRGSDGPIVFNIKNYNPVAEPTSVTTTRTLREAQGMGVSWR